MKFPIDIQDPNLIEFGDPPDVSFSAGWIGVSYKIDCKTFGGPLTHLVPSPGQNFNL